jgi:hypothetical protein
MQRSILKSLSRKLSSRKPTRPRSTKRGASSTKSRKSRKSQSRRRPTAARRGRRPLNRLNQRVTRSEETRDHADFRNTNLAPIRPIYHSIHGPGIRATGSTILPFKAAAYTTTNPSPPVANHSVGLFDNSALYAVFSDTYTYTASGAFVPIHPSWLMPNPNNVIPWAQYSRFRFKNLYLKWHGTNPSTTAGGGVFGFIKDSLTAFSPDYMEKSNYHISALACASNNVPNCRFAYTEPNCGIRATFPLDRTFTISASNTSVSKLSYPDLNDTIQGYLYAFDQNSTVNAALSGYFSVTWDIELFGQKGYDDASMPLWSLLPTSSSTRIITLDDPTTPDSTAPCRHSFCRGSCSAAAAAAPTSLLPELQQDPDSLDPHSYVSLRDISPQVRFQDAHRPLPNPQPSSRSASAKF